MSLNARPRIGVARFARDDRGNVLALFAFALIALLTAIGLAVDGSRGFTVRAELRNALDAAGLAVAREYTSHGSLVTTNDDGTINTDALEIWAADYVNEYLAANYDEGFFSSGTVTSDTTVVDIVVDGGDPGRLDITVDTIMPTYLLGLVQIDQIAVVASGSYTIGGGGGTVEVALVIDNSGSTVWGSVVQPLQDAVTSMLDELIPCEAGETNCSDENVHVSLIPFRAHMRLPDAAYVDGWAHAISGSPRGTCIDPRYSPITDENSNYIHDAYEPNEGSTYIDICGDNSLRQLGQECVVGREHGYFDYFLANIDNDERLAFGTHYGQIQGGNPVGSVLPNLMQNLDTNHGDLPRAAWPAASLDYYYLSHLDDAPPVSALPSSDPGYSSAGNNDIPRFRAANGYMGDYDSSGFSTFEDAYQALRYRPYSDSSYRHDHDLSSCSANEIVGPTSNRQDIEDEMAEWSPDGGTSMDTGMAWGWRAVSPRWQGHWGIGDSQSPLPRNYGVSGNTKSVILVTDSVAGQVARNVAMSCPIDRPMYNYPQDGVYYGSNMEGVICSGRYPYNDDGGWEDENPYPDGGVVTDEERQNLYTQYYRHQVNMLLVCEQMRQVGIEVTVVYLLPDSGGSTEYISLQNESQPIYEACATRPGDPHARAGQDYYFEVDSATELADVFAEIGSSLSALRIAQ